MKTLVKILLSILFILYFGYIFLSNPSFPQPPEDSVQSAEKADTETPLRRAYFTNYTRQQVLAHYRGQFNLPLLGTYTPILQLNYPPEESQTLIRDQTRSTYLEELVHPFRESIFVNGFEPKQAKDDIWYKGQHFQQKIIIRYVPSNLLWRIAVGLMTFAGILLLTRKLFK